MMGGNPTPGIGWAAGVERLSMLATSKPDRRRAIMVIGIGAAGEQRAVKLAKDLRQAEFKIELNYRGGLKRGLRRANKIEASAAVFLGDEELSRRGVTVRNLDDGSQTEVKLSELKDYLQKYI
jgi:histidyl-tRNA synthetase